MTHSNHIRVHLVDASHAAPICLLHVRSLQAFYIVGLKNKLVYSHSFFPVIDCADTRTHEKPQLGS